MDRRQFIVTGAASAAWLAGGGLARAQATQPDYYPADYSQLVEGSRGENGVLIYTNMNQTTWPGIMAPFKEKYPWINVEVLELGGGEVMERYLAEKGSGVRTADYMLTVSPVGWLNLVDRGEIEEYSSPETDQLPDWANPAPGVYAVSIDPVMNLWNTALVGEDMRPKSFAEVVEVIRANKDMLEGKLATHSPYLDSFAFSSHYALQKHHGEQYWQWLEEIGPLTIGERSTTPTVEKTATGEYMLGYVLSASPALRGFDGPAQAQLLGWSFMTDGTPMLMRGSAIAKGAANPNGAKLVMDYIISRDGQIALATEGGRVPARPDVTREDVNGGYTYSSIAEEVGEENLLIVALDPDMRDRYDELTERFRKVFAQS